MNDKTKKPEKNHTSPFIGKVWCFFILEAIMYMIKNIMNTSAGCFIQKAAAEKTPLKKNETLRSFSTPKTQNSKLTDIGSSMNISTEAENPSIKGSLDATAKIAVAHRAEESLNNL